MSTVENITATGTYLDMVSTHPGESFDRPMTDQIVTALVTMAEHIMECESSDDELAMYAAHLCALAAFKVKDNGSFDADSMSFVSKAYAAWARLEESRGLCEVG